jgi:hypothetical protein
MRIFISCLWLTVFLISCGKKSKDANRIPIDKMKVVVFQLMQADEHFSRVLAADSTWNIQHKNIQSYQKIYDFNKVDRVEFYKQIEYLEMHPVEFKVLMDSVNELSKREKIPL